MHVVLHKNVLCKNAFAQSKGADKNDFSNSISTESVNDVYTICV